MSDWEYRKCPQCADRNMLNGMCFNPECGYIEIDDYTEDTKEGESVDATQE